MKAIRHFVLLSIAASLALSSHVAMSDDAEGALRICSVIDAMGSSVVCTVNNPNNSVDIAIESTGADAAGTCAAFAEMAKPLTYAFTSHWKIRILSTQESDTPLAVCDLG